MFHIGELLGIEYLYNQNEKVMEDYVKAIETIETNEKSETVEETGGDEELLEVPDPTISTEDLTVSTVGLKELDPKSRGVADTSATIIKKTILRIPTDEEYQAMLTETAGEPIPTTLSVDIVDQEPSSSETEVKETFEVGTEIVSLKRYILCPEEM